MWEEPYSYIRPVMITLIDALARFPRQGRNERHDTETFKGDLRGKQKLLNDTEAECGKIELWGFACQLLDRWSLRISWSVSLEPDAERRAEGWRWKWNGSNDSLVCWCANVGSTLTYLQDKIQAISGKLPKHLVPQCSLLWVNSNSYSAKIVNLWEIHNIRN